MRVTDQPYSPQKLVNTTSNHSKTRGMKMFLASHYPIKQGKCINTRLPNCAPLSASTEYYRAINRGNFIQRRHAIPRFHVPNFRKSSIFTPIRLRTASNSTQRFANCIMRQCVIQTPHDECRPKRVSVVRE